MHAYVDVELEQRPKSTQTTFQDARDLVGDQGIKILLKNSKCSESLQIEQECRPRCFEPNATRFVSNGRRK
jgi:hypothetical protein